MKPRTLAFKILQAEWYKNLEASGFKDLEDSRGRLKDHNSGMPRSIHFNSEEFEGVRDYYVWASSKLYDGSLFQSDKDREIWRLHSQAVSSRKIEPYVDLEQWWICKKIKRIRKYLILAEIKESSLMEWDEEEQ